MRFVTVYDGQHNGKMLMGTAHENVFGRLKNDLVPPADQAFAALITDLDSRGSRRDLGDVMGEFGRTPKINVNAGRTTGLTATASFCGRWGPGGIYLRLKR